MRIEEGVINFWQSNGTILRLVTAPWSVSPTRMIPAFSVLDPRVDMVWRKEEPSRCV